MAERKTKSKKAVPAEDMEEENGDEQELLASLKATEDKKATPFPLVLRVNGATKPFDILKISFKPAEPFGRSGTDSKFPAVINGKDGIRMRTPFLHTGFGLSSKAFINKVTGKEGLPKDSIPLEFAGKSMDPFGLPNKVEEFKGLIAELDRWTVLRAIEGKWLGPDVALQTYYGTYKPLHTEPAGFADRMNLTCPAVKGRIQTGVYDWDTKKEVDKTRLEYDSLIAVEFELPFIKISHFGGTLTWGWQANAMDVILSPERYEVDYRTKRTDFKCPWA